MSNVFIISAPSGSGKSTLVGRLMGRVPGLHFSVSYTTREPRGQERDGEQYHFLTRDEFERRIAADEFLEHAEVFGNHYGTHQSELEVAASRGSDLILDIDVQGAAQLKKRLPGAVSVFILAPSREILEKRLRNRSDAPEEVVQRRLREAANEVRNYALYDYILINDDLDDATERLVAVVLAERIKRQRMEPRIKALLQEYGDVI